LNLLKKPSDRNATEMQADDAIPATTACQLLVAIISTISAN